MMPQGTTGDVELVQAPDMIACILGVGDGTIQGPSRRKARVWLTPSVVTQVHELVTPLGQNPQRVLDEGDHDQKSAKSWKIPAEQKDTVLAVNYHCRCPPS